MGSEPERIKCAPFHKTNLMRLFMGVKRTAFQSKKEETITSGKAGGKSFTLTFKQLVFL
jgi:hypothetical protein